MFNVSRGKDIAGTSVGANYREANRAESRNDFIHKIGLVEKEASESQYWLEICEEAKFGDTEKRKWLLQEAGETHSQCAPDRVRPLASTSPSASLGMSHWSSA